MSTRLERERPGPTSTECSVGVLICSYRRTDDLLRCLASLAGQQRLPDDIIVVARTEDTSTMAALSSAGPTSPPFRVVVADRPGLVHARNVGLDACRTKVLAMIDDDAIPHPGWLAAIGAHFRQDPQLGGVGGRDWCHDGERFDTRNAGPVGRLQWFGRTIGNHHLGVGTPREVDFLKGANMSYRADAFRSIRVDERLRGRGAQPFEDISFSLALRRQGWVLLYDPAIAVDHYASKPGTPRPYGGAATWGDGLAGLADLAFNEVIAIWPSLASAGRMAYPIWSFLIGTTMLPGLLQALRFSPRLGLKSWRRFRTVQRAKIEAYLELADRTPPDRSPVPGGTALGAKR